MSTGKKRARASAAKSSRAGDGALKRTKPEELFEKYRCVSEFPDADEIGPDGVMQFCQDLHIKPEDIVALILAWHFDSKRAGYFSKQEFCTGLAKLNVTDLKQLKSKLKSLEADVMQDPRKFEELYKFAFWFSRDSERTKVVERETAAAMLELLMRSRPHATQFVRWLRQAPEARQYAVLNSDQWLCFLDFSKSVHPDFSNFDENSAWPLILDEFARSQKAAVQMHVDEAATS